MSNPDQQFSVTRRTLVKSGAWSIPVIAMTVAAPAEAASCRPLTDAQKSTLLVTRNDAPATGGRTTQNALRWGYPAGTRVTWAFPVQNTGSAPIPAGVVVTIRIGKNVIPWGGPTYAAPTGFVLTSTLGELSNRTQAWTFTSTTPIAPGETRTFTASATAPSGYQGSIPVEASATSSLHCDGAAYATVTNNGNPNYPQFVEQSYPN
ncbi:hypothetical protein C5E07_13985 [Pseudoclavibacter sp. RFBJ3]|uniref:hypothetical protein n=1 Tax=unclassified Pseudoclavibacter TaxID=2615177 RepID=UPI000CE8DCC4|nr:MULTISPECIES: hypothetical protein [unclassified Pseudoclavibacter]PPF81389.1 hypothetical protein C5C12_13725 [Pseudoclavibacter sp. RFBJ5]PPF90720.1 hypothetical protein C5E07_13985 [Pseudoclavibacter sp. RFBJ3]PPG00906.1 hypothetical protein C5C19_00715 [Pseudoclavibacter sp. RFBH5]PPG21017.1 hypothetical protein C5E13_13930 [Pseudoclavibacter sp. RFBI4]